MLAVVKSKPEVGIEIMEVPEPDVKKDQVLIEVKACGICGSDLHIYEWVPFIRWVTIPRVMGHEVAGTVYKVGEEVKGFRPGDRIVADTWGDMVIVTIVDWENSTTACTRPGWVSMSMEGWQNM